MILTAEWKRVRPNLTSGVRGLLLQDGALKLVLTRVAPGGYFAPHRDDYAHLFQVRSGQVRVRVGNSFHHLESGDILEIAAGELHAYENDGDGVLELLSVNISN